MDVYIYFPSPLGTTRDVIEEALDEALEGVGEVSGGGSGAVGSNVDIEIFEGDPRDYLDRLREVLRHSEVPHDTYITIGGERFDAYG